MNSQKIDQILMKKNAFLILFLSLIILLSLFSCEKKTEENIQGRWWRQNVGDISTGMLEAWQLKNGSFFIDSIRTDGTILNTVSYGEYTVTYKNLRRVFKVTRTTNTFVIQLGEWRIQKLSKRYLTLFRSDDDTYIEFVKH
jgi:hypothetical protein